jgi:hypothetical protein
MGKEDVFFWDPKQAEVYIQSPVFQKKSLLMSKGFYL